MLAAHVALELWAGHLSSAYPGHYGDNDNVCYALIHRTGVGCVAEFLMKKAFAS